MPPRIQSKVDYQLPVYYPELSKSKKSQGDKRTFENLNDLKRQLKANGVFNNFKHQTTLRITSGKVQADIKVSYKDFYKQLENCKLALTNCNYNIEII